MIRKITALIWLRTQVLITNKVLLSQSVMPLGLLILYNMFLNKEGQLGHYMIYSLLTLAFASSSGMIVSATISEETEKKIFKTLTLSGVSNTVYLLSVLFYPVLFAIANILIFPVIVDVDFGQETVAYLVVTGLTALCVILLYLVLGFLAETQNQGQTYSLLPMLLVSFLPMFSQFSEKIATVMNYTFLDLYSSFFNDNNFKLTFSEMKISLIWVVVLSIICIGVVNKKVKSN